jgi:SNF2 family DNA or RNA helicase
MIFFENSYSADTRDQIEDRIHRRGQTGERVLYIDLSGSDLDRRIVRALQRKESLYRAVFKDLKVAEPENA